MNHHSKGLSRLFFQHSGLSNAVKKLQEHLTNGTVPKSLHVHSKVSVSKNFQEQVNQQMKEMHQQLNKSTLELIIKVRTEEFASIENELLGWIQNTWNECYLLIDATFKNWKIDYRDREPIIKHWITEIYNQTGLLVTEKLLEKEKLKKKNQENLEKARMEVDNNSTEVNIQKIVQREVQKQTKQQQQRSKRQQTQNRNVVVNGPKNGQKGRGKPQNKTSLSLNNNNNNNEKRKKNSQQQQQQQRNVQSRRSSHFQTQSKSLSTIGSQSLNQKKKKRTKNKKNFRGKKRMNNNNNKSN